MSRTFGSTEVLNRIDRDLEAILRVPLTERSRIRSRRRKGLAIALPLSLAIGAITLGVNDDEGWLSAINRPPPPAIAVQNPALTPRANLPKADQRETAPAMTAQTRSAPSEQVAVPNVGRKATTRVRRETSPGAQPQPSPVEQMEATPVQLAENQTSSNPQPSANMRADTKEDAAHDKDNALSVAEANRLATIDAVRSLRLQ